MTESTFNKKGNFIVGLLLNVVLLVGNILSVVNYINLIRISNENPIVSNYSNQYKLMCIVSVICIICVILSFVVLFMKKRQSGLGVSLLYIMGLLIYIVNDIVSKLLWFMDNDRNTPFFTDGLLSAFLDSLFYIIVPIVTIILIIIYFKIPKRAIQIASVIFVVISILYNVGDSIHTMLPLYDDKLPVLLNILSSSIPKILIIIQLIISFKFKKIDNRYIGVLNRQPQNKNSVESTEELFEYKKLLDSGAITQAEFDKKKNELLHL